MGPITTQSKMAQQVHDGRTLEGREEHVTRGDVDYTVSDGNVLSDLGLPGADKLLAKMALAHRIASIASHRHLTQAETARVLGTTQPKVSELFAGKLDGFSMERLMRFLNALDRDVCIVVSRKPRNRERGVVRVDGEGVRTEDGKVAARRSRPRTSARQGASPE